MFNNAFPSGSTWGGKTLQPGIVHLRRTHRSSASAALVVVPFEPSVPSPLVASIFWSSTCSTLSVVIWASTSVILARKIDEHNCFIEARLEKVGRAHEYARTTMAGVLYMERFCDSTAAGRLVAWWLLGGRRCTLSPRMAAR